MPFDFNERPIRVYNLWPESPCPIESSVYGWCQMACGYCFANLNRIVNGDEINPKSSLAKWNHTVAKAVGDPYSPLGHFIREKYPIVFSNTTDPFQREETTYRCSEAVMKWAAIEGQPLFIQTRGNVLYEDFPRYRDLIQPGKDVVYMSICQMDDKLRKRHEPGAMPIEKRFELCRMMADRGTPVIVACNPYLAEWVPDKEAFCRRSKEHGAKAVFVDPMHFTKKQSDAMAPIYHDLPVKAGMPESIKMRVMMQWIDACRKIGISPAMSPSNNERTGYYCHPSGIDPSWITKGKIWNYQYSFINEVRQVAEENPGEYICFTAKEFVAHAERRGCANVLLNAEDFWLPFNARVNQDRKEWNETVGGVRQFHDIIKYWCNHPQETTGFFYFDRNVHLVENENNEYIGDEDGDVLFSYVNDDRTPPTEKDLDQCSFFEES